MERNGFRFDQRVQMPEIPEGKAVIKCYGMPLVVSAAAPGERVLPCGMTETQLREKAQYIATIDKGGALTRQKMMVARGQVA
ncbi:MAG TPA: hypothetical protein VLE91_01195 [Candidatus Saccharimonadales bacterium]|nr:hypothetical protein [Candidatus Saccharimonadales bacterium]